MIELHILAPDGQESIQSFDKSEVLIGRRAQSDLVLSSPSVSSKHARLLLDDGEIWLQDLGSTNGIYVDEELVEENTRLLAGDRFEIGGFILTLRAVHEPAAPVKGDDLSLPAPYDLHHAPSTAAAPIYDGPPGASPGPTSDGSPSSLQPETGGHRSTMPVEIVGGAPLGASRSPANAAHSHPVAPGITASPMPPGGVRGVRAPLDPLHPRIPICLEDTGLTTTLMVELLVKVLCRLGASSGTALAQAIRLPYEILEPLLEQLERDQFVSFQDAGQGREAESRPIALTRRGVALAERCQTCLGYDGPAPVPLDDYVAAIRAHGMRHRKVPKACLVDQLSHLVLEDAVYDVLGPALSDGKGILVYGPAGNGKTNVCQHLIGCFDDPVLIPYAVEADGILIQIFDQDLHVPVGKAETPGDDPRYVRCHRPVVRAGGELTLDGLELKQTRAAGVYEAPLQMKANGGLLLVDDFGRQKITPTDLMNRFMGPLETEMDIMLAPMGKQLMIPFEVFVAFVTNLDPAALVEDAFLRRVPYKLKLSRPRGSQYKAILEAACQKADLRWSDEGFKRLVNLYKGDQRPINACEPGSLVQGIQQLADYLEVPASLSPELVARAYQSFFCFE